MTFSCIIFWSCCSFSMPRPFTTYLCEHNSKLPYNIHYTVADRAQSLFNRCISVIMPHFSSFSLKESRNVELNITVCSSRFYNAWRGAYIAYTVLLILGLMFIGIQNQNITSRFKNSKVAARFNEEGNSTGRVTLISVFIFVVFFLVLLFLQTDIKLYVPTFWMNICWSLLLPVMLLCAIYIPKVNVYTYIYVQLLYITLTLAHLLFIDGFLIHCIYFTHMCT